MTRLRLILLVGLVASMTLACSKKEEVAAPAPAATDTAAAAAAAAKAAQEAIETDTAKAHDLIVNYDGDKTDLDAAMELIKSVLTRDREYAPAYLELARLEYRAGYVIGDERELPRMENALKFVKHALSLNEELPEAHALEARVHLELGEYDLAEQSLEHAVTGGVAEPELDAIRARIASAYDDEREAVRLAREVSANENAPKALRFEMFTFIGSHLARGGFREEAQQQYEKAIDALPGSPWGYANLASFQLDHDYIEAGLQNAEKAFDVRPFPAGVRVLARASVARSEQLFRMKNRAGAEDVISRLEQKVPAGNPDVDQMLGDYFSRLYDETSLVSYLDVAIEKYRAVLAADPDRADTAATLELAIRRRADIRSR